MAYLGWILFQFAGGLTRCAVCCHVGSVSQSCAENGRALSRFGPGSDSGSGAAIGADRDRTVGSCLLVRPVLGSCEALNQGPEAESVGQTDCTGKRTSPQRVPPWGLRAQERRHHPLAQPVYLPRSQGRGQGAVGVLTGPFESREASAASYPRHPRGSGGPPASGGAMDARLRGHDDPSTGSSPRIERPLGVLSSTPGLPWPLVALLC